MYTSLEKLTTNCIFFILISPLGCFQRLSDLAMLAQSPQRVRHCNDTERRVSVPKMSSSCSCFYCELHNFSVVQTEEQLH